MRVLVLGGTRFIGPPAVRRLVAGGHQVAVFHRGQSNAPLPPDVQPIYGDFANVRDFAATFRQIAPDVVLHMNASTETDGSTLVELFTDIAGRVVAISSADVYRAYDRLRGVDAGPPDPTPLTEDSPLRDRLYPYRTEETQPDAAAFHYEKILMERAVLSAPETLPATILRLPMVYGPDDYQQRLFEYLKRMDDGRPFILLPDDIASWRGLRGYVEDVGEAIALCVTSPQAANRIYHVAEESNLTEAEWVRRIGQAAGWNGNIVTLPNTLLPKHLQHEYDTRQDWSLDSTRIRRELGYTEPTLPDKAMARSVAWQRTNPPATFDPAQFDYASEDAAFASNLQTG